MNFSFLLYYKIETFLYFLDTYCMLSTLTGTRNTSEQKDENPSWHSQYIIIARERNKVKFQKLKRCYLLDPKLILRYLVLRRKKIKQERRVNKC